MYVNDVTLCVRKDTHSTTTVSATTLNTTAKCFDHCGRVKLMLLDGLKNTMYSLDHVMNKETQES